MNVWHRPTRLWLAAAMLAALTAAAPAGDADDETAPDQADAEANARPDLKFIDLNREQQYVDVEAEICLTEGMLELAATIAHGKEHESVVAVKARPQHIHLALLMLGLEPGKPGSWELNDGDPKPIPAEGDPVRVSLILENEEGEREERPITDFIRQSGTDEQLPGDVFLFAGSRIIDPPEDDPYYLADVTGEVIALVSFDGELLAWPKPASQANEQLIWQIDEEHIPELGTEVTLRLRVVEDWDGPDDLPDPAETEPPDPEDRPDSEDDQPRPFP